MFIALFEDGDVPGERMFSFNSKQRKAIQKSSISKKNMATNGKIKKLPVTFYYNL